MRQPMKSVGIRIEGTVDQIGECLRRLSHVLFFSRPASWRDTDNPLVKLAYLRGYFYDPDTLLNQLEAAHRDIQHLTEALGEAELELQRLKEKLQQLPKPQPYDAVLGSRNVVRENG